MTDTITLIEESLIGAALQNRDARDIATDRLSFVHFLDPRNAHVFGALAALAERGGPSDPATVIAELEKDEILDAVGGIDRILDLAATPTTRDKASVEAWTETVRKAYAKRALSSVAVQINELAAGGGDASALLDQAERLISEIERPSGEEIVTAATLIAEQHERLERVRRGEVDRGVPTGISGLDEVLGGLVEDRMYIVAARPGMGKTSLAYTFLDSGAVTHKRPALLVSLEMSGYEVIQRMTAARGQIDTKHLDSGHLTPEESIRFESVAGDLSGAPLYLLDSGELTVPSIRAAARKIKQQVGDLGLIVIDYIQLMTGSGGRGSDNRQQEVSDISRSLKLMARELHVPVVALSQLSRNVEQRQDKRPMLADLRESGSLEQDADVVLMIYRDEQYNPATDEPGVAELIVAKHRQGESNVTVKSRWVPEWTAFMDLDGAPPPSRQRNVPVPAAAGVPEEF